MFIAFAVMPIVEFSLLYLLYRYTSFLMTLLFILGTGVLGIWLARTQGVAVSLKIQQELAAGRMPTRELIDGGIVLVASLLLISPGVLTDVIGILLMIPFVRYFARRMLVRWFQRNFKIQIGTTQQDPNVVDSVAKEVA